MNIVFLPVGCLPFSGNTLDERPLGGTETGVIRLAAALKSLGHQVTVLSDLTNPPLTSPLYVPIHAAGFLKSIDVLIGVRDWKSAFFDIPAKKRFLWTGDAFDQPSTIGIGDKRIIDQLDGLLCVSEWQQDTMCKVSGFPITKTHVIKNGIDPELFVGQRSNNPKRLIYSSTPYRGLRYLLPIFKAVKEQVPDAELAIASGYDVYAGSGEVPLSQQKELEILKQSFSAMPGVTWLGNLTQKALACEMMKSGIYAYPNIFAETSCISVMEAKAAGIVPITTDLGALPSTVGNGGIVIASGANTSNSAGISELPSDVVDNFIKTVVDVMLQEETWRSYSNIALEEAKSNRWIDVAQRLIRIFA